MPNYVSYRELISQIDLAAGDIVNVSSDIRKLMCVCRENNETFDPNVFVDAILDKVGEEGTVLFPTYYWKFCQGQPFDILKSPSQTGSLTNIVLARPDFKRTKHPIYSFAVCGKDQDYLCSLENFSAFSDDSPFGYLYHKRAKNLFVGIDYKYACAFVHYAEEMVGVEYRYFKEFSGTYIGSDRVERSAKCQMYVRDLELDVVTEIGPMMDEALLTKNCYCRYDINGVYFGLLDVHPTVDIMMADIKGKRALVYPKASC